MQSISFFSSVRPRSPARLFVSVLCSPEWQCLCSCPHVSMSFSSLGMSSFHWACKLVNSNVRLIGCVLISVRSENRSQHTSNELYDKFVPSHFIFSFSLARSFCLLHFSSIDLDEWSEFCILWKISMDFLERYIFDYCNLPSFSILLHSQRTTKWEAKCERYRVESNASVNFNKINIQRKTFFCLCWRGHSSGEMNLWIAMPRPFNIVSSTNCETN